MQTRVTLMAVIPNECEESSLVRGINTRLREDLSHAFEMTVGAMPTVSVLELRIRLKDTIKLNVH